MMNIAGAIRFWRVPASQGARPVASRLALLPLGILGALLLSVVASAQLAHLNSDQLYLPSLYEDLFVNHGSLRAWVLPPAPSFFPDLVLYAVVKPFTTNVGLAFALAVCAQFALTVALAGWLLRTACPSYRVPWIEVLLSGIALLLLLAAHPMSHDFFSMTHHVGALAVGIALAALWTRTLDQWRASEGVATALLVFLGAASDLIFVPQFVLPLCFATLFLGVSRRLSRRAAARPLMATGAGLVAAIGVIRFLQTKGSAAGAELARAGAPGVTPESPHGFIRLAGPVLGENVVDLSAWLSGPFSVLLVVALLAAAVIARRSWREQPTRDRDRTLFVCVFFLGCMACTLCGPVATLGVDPRYMQPVYFLPALFLPWFLRALGWSAVQRVSLLGVSAFAVFLAACSSGRPLAPASFHLPYPASVACVDRVAEDAGAEYAFASYWYARYIQFHSRRGLFVNELSEDLGPRVWISSRSWYARATAARPDRVVVVSARLPVERFDDVLGRPLRVSSCPGFDVYTYDYSRLSSGAKQALGADVH